jgi:hypothetical protein
MDEKGKDSGSGAESDHLGQDLGTPITAPAMLFLPGSAMERAKARLLLLKFWRKTLAFVRSMGVGPEIAIAIFARQRHGAGKSEAFTP